MARFKFTLEPLLTLRKRQEEMSLLQLAAAERELRSELDTKELLLHEKEQSLLRREQIARTEEASSNEFVIEDAYIQGTKVRITQADHRIRRAERTVEKARDALQESRKRKRQMEIIKDRKQSEFNVAEEKKHWKQVEDGITVRTARKQIELQDETAEGNE